MGTAGKQLSSMKRYVEDLKVKLGETFNDALTIAVFGFSDALKEANAEADTLSQNGSLRTWGRETIEVLAIMGDFIKNIAVDIRTLGTVSAIAAAQVGTLTRPGGLAEFKQLNSLYADVFKERNESMDSMQRAAETYFAAKDVKQNSDLNRERNYLSDLARLRKDYANESVKTQQMAVKMLTDTYYPETVAGPKPTRTVTSNSDAEDAKSKAASEYATLIKSSKDYIQSLKEETQEIGLNSEQVRMLQAARAAAAAPTDVLKMAIMQNAQALAVATLAEKDNEAALKATEEALKETQTVRDAYLKTLVVSAESAEKALEQMLLEEEALTISEEKHISLSLAIDGVNLQRLEEQRILAILNGDDTAVALIQREIDARKELLTLMEKHEVRDASTKAAKDAADEWQRTSDNIERSLTDALLRGFESGAGFGKNFADTLVNMFATLVLRPLIQPVAQGAADGFSGLLGIIGELFMKDGAAMTNGSVQAFASGGILGPTGGLLEKPTLFPMADGGIGIGGEAGTEAVMPLERNSQGKLGVSASGLGGGTNVVVNVVESPGNGGKTKERTEGNTRIVDVLVEQIKSAVAQDFMTGGNIAKSAERTYGLNRAAGAY